MSLIIGLFCFVVFAIIFGGIDVVMPNLMSDKFIFGLAIFLGAAAAVVSKIQENERR
jgi:uncharacterized membrane protein YvlD (DUF360 family)